MIPAGRLLLDTNCLVYLLEGTSSPEHEYMVKLLELGAGGDAELLTSTVSLAELLVGVARRGSRADVERAQRAFLGLPGLSTRPVGIEVAREGAIVRERTGLRLFDAIIVATGVIHQADALISNDRQLVRADHGLRAIYLAEAAAER
ncbi:MAG: PIN domain-containing protein [Dehalococcoidia bacterium]|nr:PIN domain-containing protein [Dehalococcoidia bacterium]